MKVVVDMKSIIAMLLLALAPLNLWAAINMFSAHVDKTSIKAGESFTLTLEYSGQSSDEPDLAPLHKDFTIISRQTSQESSFVNGNHRAKTSWILEILPKSSVKDLVIPKVKLGRESTEPISITQSGETPANSTNEIALSVTTDRDNVYVNGELIVNISIKTAMSLRNGTLSKLEIKDAIIEPLVEGDRSEVLEQGIKYNVFKQSFAIFPSKAGALTIPPIVFKGVTVADGRGGRGLGGFFSGGTRVSSQSKPLSITVKDIPNEFPAGQQFLPLKSFVIIEAFDEPDPQFEVSKATSRRFEMKAKGTLASFLPQLVAPAVKDLQVYAEAGNKIQKSEQDGMEASTKFAHIYMPTAPGQVLVPEQTIYWWDTDEDKLKTTVIRALHLDVKGDALSSPPLAPPVLTEPSNEQPKDAVPLASQPVESGLWKIVAAVFFLLWLITLTIFIVSRKVRAKKLPVGRNASLREQLAEKVAALVKACVARDAKAVYVQAHALCRWVEMGDKNISNDGELRALVLDLEKALYERHTSLSVADVLPRIQKAAQKMKIDEHSIIGLAPLYPQ